MKNAPHTWKWFICVSRWYFKWFNKSINSRCVALRHTCSSETALQALVGHIRYCRCALKCDTWKSSVAGIYLLTMSYICHPTTGVPSKGWKSLAVFRQPFLSLSPTKNVNYTRVRGRLGITGSDRISWEQFVKILSFRAKPRNLHGSPGRFLRSLRSVEMTEKVSGRSKWQIRHQRIIHSSWDPIAPSTFQGRNLTLAQTDFVAMLSESVL